jgi:plasmid maintenance system antidote protein VapI
LLKRLIMAQKEKEKKSIGQRIREHFSRNQGWLAKETGISEAQLSRKMNGTRDWTQDELDKINKLLGENFKL